MGKYIRRGGPRTERGRGARGQELISERARAPHAPHGHGRHAEPNNSPWPPAARRGAAAAAGVDPGAVERRRDVRAARRVGPAAHTRGRGPSAPPTGAPARPPSPPAAPPPARAATVDQCKNRLDYLKKRLKAERSRSKGAPAPPPPPPSVDRLRALLRLAPSVPPGFTSRGGAMPKVGEEEQEEEEEKAESFAAPLPRSWPSVPKRPRTAVALLPLSSSSGHQHGDGGGTPCTEVAAALDRLAGTYERVEVAKQKEATRLEERRLEAMRDLEIERMRILVDVAISASAVADTATAASSSW